MTRPSAPYILWLPSWYPNKLAPFDGDFIQRHAKAVALHIKVHVIFVRPDEEEKVTSNIYESFTKNGDLTEHLIYFKKTTTFFGRINSFRQWMKLSKKAIKKCIKENGKPELVHVHIALRAGIIAKWIKRRWGIDYVISEQWGGYLPEAEEKLSDLPGYMQMYWRSIMRNAAAVSVVSTYLGQCLNKILQNIAFTVIPNVVDTSIFKPANSGNNETVSFIHISLLNYQKNVADILRSLDILKKERQNFRLIVFGPKNSELIKLMNDLGLQDEVSFHQEVPQNELAKFIQQADALILFSRYETFGCVIIEALACGKPVILSDLPVMHENAEEGFNAVFAKNENPADLAEKLKWFVENRASFNATEIANRAAYKYNYNKVGKEFTDWYEQTIQTST